MSDIKGFTTAELYDAVHFGTLTSDAARTPGLMAVIDNPTATRAELRRAIAATRHLPATIITTTNVAQNCTEPALLNELVDVVADDLSAIIPTILRNPVAATAGVLLMRSFSPRQSVQQGLIAESTTYSLLQTGVEFQTWRNNTPVRPRPSGEHPVVATRRDSTLSVTLNRPHVRNALDTTTLQQMCEGFMVAVADHRIKRVELRGNGPSFCSGGDLDDFGNFDNPSTAHFVRLARSPARLAWELRNRLHAFVHGACAGSGVEIPAFAHHVVADPSTTFRLPEVGIGLIPGAGGTVSVARRIGRLKTNLMMLTGLPIDAPTALSWGLVDEINPVERGDHP